VFAVDPERFRVPGDVEAVPRDVRGERLARREPEVLVVVDDREQETPAFRMRSAATPTGVLGVTVTTGVDMIVATGPSTAPSATAATTSASVTMPVTASGSSCTTSAGTSGSRSNSAVPGMEWSDAMTGPVSVIASTTGPSIIVREIDSHD
jgi:hypothetical protein